MRADGSCRLFLFGQGGSGAVTGAERFRGEPTNYPAILVQSPYVDNDDYQLTSFDVSDSRVADDGANEFDATATFENSSFRTTMNVVATYSKEGGSYTPSFEVSDASTKAIAGIEYDPQGILSQADRENIESIDFDEDAQTCTVSVNYKPEWFENVQGDVKYAYRFDGSKWGPDADANAAAQVSYNPLIATYDQFSADTDKGGCLTKIEIVNIDEKTNKVTANVTWTRRQALQPCRNAAALRSVADDYRCHARRHRERVRCIPRPPKRARIA